MDNNKRVLFLALMLVAAAMAGPQSYAKKTKICGYNGKQYKVFSSAQAMKTYNSKQTDVNLRYVKKPLLDCTKKPCPKVCADLYDPVCATNGKESKLFGNQCELQNQNKCVAKSPDQVYMSQNISICTCTLNCPAVSYPVATTGGWFDNECLMDESNFCNGTDYSTLGWRDYSDPPIQCPAVCGEVYAPVCANDGNINQTFGNLCLMNGYNRCVRGTTEPHFQVVPFSQRVACLQTSVMSCPMNCYRRRFEPLCATDGTTFRLFPSSCELLNYNNCGELTPRNFVQTAMTNC